MLQALIDVVIPVFIVIGAGYGTTRAGYFTATQIDALMKFTQGFAIPCLLFLAIAGIDLGSSFDPRLILSFYAGAFLCFLAGLFGARYIFGRDWEDAVAIGFCCLFSNSVLLGLAITERAFGVDSLDGNYIIIALHAPFCYGVGVTAMEIVRGRGQSGVKVVTSVLTAMFKNMLIIAIALGAIVNIANLPLPAVAEDGLGLIARAGLPCALFALGGVLVQYRPEGDMRIIVYICAITLALHPALVWIFGTALALKAEFFRSAVLTGAMAPGVNAYIFSNLYGRAKRVVASSVLFATAASILTVWFWLIALGSH